MEKPKAMKSCDYCRYRKKRCVRSNDSQRCESCEYVDVPCVYSNKKQSERRRTKSRQIATRVLGSTSSEGGAPSPSAAASSQDDEITYKSGLRAHMFRLIYTEPALASTSSSASLGSREKYISHIQLFTPYIVAEDLRHCSAKLSKFIDICARLSLNMDQPHTPTCHFLREVIELTNLMDIDTAIGIMLLAFHLDLDPELILSATSKILGTPTASLPLLAGACVVNTWIKALYPGLIGRLPYDQYNRILKSFMEFENNNIDTFGMQHTLLTHKLLRLLQITDTNSLHHESNSAIVLDIAGIESELLSFSLHVTLVDLRDDYPSCYPQTVVISVVYNTVLLYYYHTLLEYPHLSSKLFIRPKPAVVHLLDTLALTNFRAPKEVCDRWWLVAECQAMSAATLVKLLTIGPDPNSTRQVLEHWRQDYPKFERLHRQVNSVTKGGPWHGEQLDSFSLFWTFRDVRSLALEQFGVKPSSPKRTKERSAFA